MDFDNAKVLLQHHQNIQDNLLFSRDRRTKEGNKSKLNA